MRTNKIIRFQGKQYILAERQEFLSGSKDIYEPEELKAGRRSYAIVNAEGEIWRHHQLIGTMSDVEILPGEDHTELEASPLEVVLNVLADSVTGTPN
jgi:hypothetical protein